MAAAQPAPTRAALQAEDDGIAPLSVRAPEYPRRARIAGLEGYVTLSYSIRADGRVAGVRVDDASPSRVFDRAAREALEAWRFPVGSGAGERLQQTFDPVKGQLYTLYTNEATGRGGASGAVASWARGSACASAMLHRLRCSTMTPFGWPVEPEV